MKLKAGRAASSYRRLGLGAPLNEERTSSPATLSKRSCFERLSPWYSRNLLATNPPSSGRARGNGRRAVWPVATACSYSSSPQPCATQLSKQHAAKLRHIYTRLAADKKLRKNVRAMLDGLVDAGTRMRRRRSHRIRNALLVLVGVVSAALAFPRVRPWLEEQAPSIFGTESAEPDSVT